MAKTFENFSSVGGIFLTGTGIVIYLSKISTKSRKISGKALNRQNQRPITGKLPYGKHSDKRDKACRKCPPVTLANRGQHFLFRTKRLLYFQQLYLQLSEIELYNSYREIIFAQTDEHENDIPLFDFDGFGATGVLPTKVS